MKLRDYLLNPSGETGQELLDIVDRLLNSRVIIIEKCSECPNFTGQYLHDRVVVGQTNYLMGILQHVI
jgi:hypothetical protein